MFCVLETFGVGFIVCRVYEKTFNDDITLYISRINEYATVCVTRHVRYCIEFTYGRVCFYVPEEPEGFHRVWNDGNKLQDHISHWKEEDFVELGFKVERDVNAHSDTWDGKPFRFDALWVSL